MAHFELGVSGWQEPTEAIKSWDNVVSIKVCSELCLTANSSRINSWIFDSPNSNCTCLDLPPNYQCRQWFGKSVSLEDIEMPDVSILVMESRAPLNKDCTGELSWHLEFSLFKWIPFKRNSWFLAVEMGKLRWSMSRMI